MHRIYLNGCTRLWGEPKVPVIDRLRSLCCLRPTLRWRLSWSATGLIAALALSRVAGALPNSPALVSATPLPPTNGLLQPTVAGVAFDAWVGELSRVLDTIQAPAVEREFTAFAARHRLPTDNESLRRDYRRVRLLFEAIRDGGFWHLRWDVTDQPPSSKRIWRAFIDQPPVTDFAAPSATAECDESSALMGLLARRLGIANVGLFYPTWNHTIAAWAPLGGKARETTLVMLPTTQIFLECDAGFDFTSFKTGLRNIEPYPSWDIKKTTLLPQARADWLLDQIRAYAGASTRLWTLMRAARAYTLGSSMGSCRAMRSALSSDLQRELTDGDRSALKALAARELHRHEASARAVLEWLGKGERPTAKPGAAL